MGLLLHLLIIIMSALVVHGARQMQSWATVPGPSGSQLGLGAGVGVRLYGVAFINRSSFRRGHGMHTHNYFNMQFALRYVPFSSSPCPCLCACPSPSPAGSHWRRMCAWNAPLEANQHMPRHRRDVSLVLRLQTGVYFPYNEN